MQRNIFVLALVGATCMLGVAHAGFQVTWDGGTHMWYTFDINAAGGNWNGGQKIQDLVGVERGHGGYKDTNGAVDFMIDGGFVGYDGFVIDNDFRLLQGDTMTITGGGVFEARLLDADSVNDPLAEEGGGFGTLFRHESSKWTEMDMSELNLDNGTFRRTGESFFDPTDSGGGAMLFASWKGDDNFGDRDGDNDTDGGDFLNWQLAGASAGDLRKVRGTYGDNPQTQTINVNISNGGSLQNVGTMIFAKAKDWQADITVTVNDGTITAEGGLRGSGIVVEETDIENAEASIAFVQTTGFEDAFTQKTVFNFTGPGSVTVDEGAIRVLNITLDAAGDIATSDIVDASYEDLWDAGILQANGGNAGAFGDHFSVTGAWGDAVYTLTSNVVAASAGISAVPEPTSIMLTGLAVLSFAGVTRRRRA